MSKFKANKGGHAPGHLRDALTTCIEDWGSSDPWYAPLASEAALYFLNPNQQREWEAKTPPQRGLWLTGQLWNCGDCLPSSYCEELEIPTGSSYAVAARKLRDEIEPLAARNNQRER